MHKSPKDVLENLLPILILVRTNLFIPSRFTTTYKNFDNAVSATQWRAEKNYISARATSTISALNYCGGIFSNRSAIYTKLSAQTFPPIFWDFSQILTAISRILWRHLAMQMWTVYCASESTISSEKNVETASKFIHKPRRNGRSNYAPRRTHSPPDRSVTKKQTPHFCPYSRRALFDLSKFCMVVELVVLMLKGANHFSIQFIVFPLGGNVDFWLLSKNNTGRLPLRGICRWKAYMYKRHIFANTACARCSIYPRLCKVSIIFRSNA